MSHEERDHACEKVELPNSVKAQVRPRCSLGVFSGGWGGGIGSVGSTVLTYTHCLALPAVL